ncbi:MAG: fimbrillin family protein [Bacteroidaceae bacterium]|nr:fimbrillin family protein [Bacteroidaceae bacterium]
MTACGNDEVQDAIIDYGPPVKINVSAGIQTRASNNAWTANDAIGVFSMSGTTAEYANKKYITPDGDGNFTAATDDDIVWLPSDGGSRSVLAYYPYVTGCDGTYSIDVSDQTDQEAIDFMVSPAVNNVNKTQPDVTFVFSHKLVKIQLNIRSGDGITAEQLANMKVTLSNQYTTATCNVLTNADVVVTGTEVSTLSFLTSADGTTSEAIVLPAATTEGMVLQFEVPEVGTYSWAVRNSANSQSFAVGNKYIYNVNVNKTGIIVTSQIEDWASGNGSGEDVNAE